MHGSHCCCTVIGYRTDCIAYQHTKTLTCRDGILIQGLLQCSADLQWCLSSKLHNDALWSLHLHKMRR